MSTAERKQINIRFEDSQVERIDALRRNRSPIPTVSDLIRALIDEAYDREIAKPRGRK